MLDVTHDSLLSHSRNRGKLVIKCAATSDYQILRGRMGNHIGLPVSAIKIYLPLQNEDPTVTLCQQTLHHFSSTCHSLVAMDLPPVLNKDRQPDRQSNWCAHCTNSTSKTNTLGHSTTLSWEVLHIPAKNECKFLTPHQGWTPHSLQQLQVTFLGEAEISFVSCHPAVKNLISA